MEGAKLLNFEYHKFSPCQAPHLYDQRKAKITYAACEKGMVSHPLGTMPHTKIKQESCIALYLMLHQCRMGF